MDTLLEILKYTIPALIVMFTTWMLLRSWAKNEKDRRKHDFNMHIQDEVLPIRLQAYERIILFLERISHRPIDHQITALLVWRRLDSPAISSHR